MFSWKQQVKFFKNKNKPEVPVNLERKSGGI